jgi:hypothetical protein
VRNAKRFIYSVIFFVAVLYFSLKLGLLSFALFSDH